MSDPSAPSAQQLIVRRAAQELWDGCYVNFGIGLPSQVLRHVPEDVRPFVHTENGILGAWPQPDRQAMDPQLIDAGGAYVRTRHGGCHFDSATSFAMVRSGRLDLCMLGAFEVDAQGDLANWRIPGQFTPGMGGGIELAERCRRVIVLTTSTDKRGRSKLREVCSLPLTARHCVQRVITELGVLDIDEQGFVVRELMPGVTASDMAAAVAAPLRFALVSAADEGAPA
jgi:3-oxoacid CoA-transferase B subunit